MQALQSNQRVFIFNHMQKLRQHATLLTWAGITGYTIFVIATTHISMQRAHLLNFLMLGIAVLFQLTRTNLGRIVPLFAMLGCMFTTASFTPSVYFLRIGSFSIGWSYLILILLFLLLNRKELPVWWRKMV